MRLSLRRRPKRRPPLIEVEEQPLRIPPLEPLPPEAVFNDRNMHIPAEGLWRRCDTCGFVGVALPEHNAAVLDWIMADHFYRFHATP